MVKTKNLSNPFSTGGGGGHFEAHVQASFVVLMITGGYAPCLPNWPIVEIKFQGKIDGFDTDDLIVFIENPENKERRKLLGQVKHSISVTKSDESFHEVIQAAWNDFNNPEVFIKDKDKIALITSPLNRTDFDNVQWLLNQVRHTKNVGEFFRNVEQANFSPSMSIKKLLVIQEHLNRANGGNEVSRDELYNFLKHFNLLSYDLGNEYGVVLSLLHSHISQFNLENPQLVWSRAVDIAQTWNQDGGTLTRDNLPEDLLEALQHKAITEMPKGLITSPETPKPDWAQHQDAIYLAFAVLMGAWNEKSKSDIDAITHMFGISYDIWLQKAQEILHHPASPLSFRNGVWRVVNRAELWKQLGSRILDQNLTTFKALAVSILKEIDPAFELSAEERFAASIHGKVLNYSLDLRKGIAEGLANLGSQPDLCSNCSQGIAEATCVLAIREILTDADWVQWGSLNSVLPILAEAAPSEFLDKVEKAMRQSPCPFDELFNQEGNGVFGENYLTGLLWALESLAWDEQHLVRVCVVLGELASRDPGGQWANRPSNSLITIFLPWLPQTLASVDKRKVAIQTLLFEWPDIAWNLLIKLLPGQQSTSSRSYKPIWRNSIPDDRGTGVSNQEYWQQVSFYSELAVESAGYNILRLNELIKHFDNLPKPAFDQLFNLLASPIITELPEDQRFLIWEHLIKFTNKHRRFPDAKWVLPTDLITRIETITERLAPTNPFYLYQTLFSENDFDLYESNDDWEEQQKILNSKRETAVANILQGIGVQKLILFSETVNSPEKVGNALGVIENESLEQTFFPQLLGSPERKHKALVSGFIFKEVPNKWLGLVR